ncbi:MAG: transposase [Deltaproteobacteria bacterium]|nr:transposase [Deltaproteobacteria bacterium]
MLDEADGCKDVPGAIGALLRREGLYSSHLATWRKQRERGELDGLRPKKRGRKAKPNNPLAVKVRELEAENRRLQRQLEKAETIIAFQKKLSEMLGIPLERKESDETC